MGRGGFRPGSGPAKGTRYKSRASKMMPIDSGSVKSEKIRKMLALKTKAKAKIFSDLLSKIKGGESISLAEKNLMDVLAVELMAEIDGKAPKTATGEVLTPLDYMLKVMNDQNEDKDLRARMAVSAAPFCHPRKGEGAGKKEEKADKAVTAGKGRFRASKPPKLKLMK